MDFMQDSEEDSKYAFLLGSALRNDDTEQLFVVYDNLIPSSVSECRLERIKEGARYISELPECDFNALVLNARTFSLASGRCSTIGSMSMDCHSNRLSGLDEDEESEAVSIMQGEQASITRYGSLNHQASLKPTSSKAVDESLKLDLISGDQDSGFRGGSSFKASSLKNSISCSEIDSEEDRPGCFNYTQLTPKNRTGDHVRIRPTLNPDYDEDIRIDSSTGGSSVESPRSETSVTHEEYSLAEDVEMQEFNHSSQDFRKTDGGFPASVTAVNEHQYLYGKHNHNEYYEFDSLSNIGPKRAERTEALRNSYNCFQDSVLGSSGAAGQKKSRVSMGSRGYSKDDSDKVTSPIGLDVNGNPPAQELGGSALDLGNYQQMRQSVNSSKVVEGGSSSLSTPSNHHTATQAPLSLGEPGSEFGKKQRLRKKKRHPQQKIYSETIGNFKGNEPIDYLLSFIEGGDNNIDDCKKASPQNNSGSAGKSEKHKKKQEKNKVELNGPQDKTTANDTKTIKSPPPVIYSSAVMGNSTAKDSVEDKSQIVATTTTTTNNPISTTVSSRTKKNTPNTVEDHDHNSGEFFDCVNSFSGDDKRNISLSSDEQCVIESNRELIKQELTVSNRNYKNDVKNSSGMKGNGKKYRSDRIEDSDNESNQNSCLSKQRTNSFDLAPNSLKVTDVKIEDVAAQESTQAFIEVKKKKKRNVSSFTSLSGNVQQQNHSYYPKDINSQTSFNKPWRPQRPTQTGSINGTTHNNAINSNIVENNKPSTLVIRNSNDNTSFDKFSRDLSPSSFPVLMCHTNASSNIVSRPERRNSCGDINDVKAEVVSETRSYCDSDRESVKSLPAAHNVRATGESSPLYPVSYATMLVTAQRERHHNGDTSHSPSSESGIVCGSQTSSIHSYHPHSSLEMVSPPPAEVSDANCSGGSSTPDRKTTVWKGSPRERRHSIGSSPDDNKPETDKSSVNSRHRQKSGSQECLAVNLASSSQSSLPGMKEATTKELDSSTTSSNQVHSLHYPETNVETADSPRGKLRNKSTNISQSSSSRSIQSSNTPVVHHASPPSSEVAGGDNPSVSKRTITEKQPGSTDIAVANKKGNGNNTKSVVFLDARFRSSKATDLGITFGFDSSIEPKMDFQALPSSNKETGHQEGQVLTSSNVTMSLPSISPPSNVQQQQRTSTPILSQLTSSNIPTTSAKSSNSSSQHHSSETIQQQPLIASSCSEKAIEGLITDPSNGLVLPPGSVLKGTQTNPSVNISSATALTTTSDSRINSTAISKGIVTKTDNETVCQSENTHSCGKNNNSRPSTTPNSTPANLLPQPTMPQNVNAKQEGKKVTHTVPHPPSNQQPSHVVPPHPNANNSPLVISHAFIGQTVLFSPHFPPPPIHPQVVAMPHPPLPSVAIMDRLSSTITTVPPATNLITTNQTPDVPNVTVSSIPTSVASPPPQSLSPSSNESATVTSPITTLPSDAKTESTTTQPLDCPIKVVYGLRIRPDGGCGTVFFRPFEQSNKKQKKNNLAELTGLLKRKWTEIKDIEKKGTEKYITVSDQ